MSGTPIQDVLEKINATLDKNKKTVVLLFAVGEAIYVEYLSAISEALKESYNVVSVFVGVNPEKIDGSCASIYLDNKHAAALRYFDFSDLFIANTSAVGAYLPENKPSLLIKHGSITMPTGTDEQLLGQGMYFDFWTICSNYCSYRLEKAFRHQSAAIRGNPHLRSIRKTARLVPVGNPKHVSPDYRPAPAKRIVIAPTSPQILPPEYSLFWRSIEVVETICGTLKDYDVVFRPHLGFADHPIVSVIHSMKSSFHNISVDASHSSTSNMYVNTTIFVTDISGGAFSFMKKVGRPAVFCVPTRNALDDNFRVFGDIANGAGFFTQEISNIPAFVQAYEANEEMQNDRCRSFMERNFYTSTRENIRAAVGAIVHGTLPESWPVLAS